MCQVFLIVMRIDKSVVYYWSHKKLSVVCRGAQTSTIVGKVDLQKGILGHIHLMGEVDRQAINQTVGLKAPLKNFIKTWSRLPVSGRAGF